MKQRLTSRHNYIPARIKEARVTREMTQTELASIINVTKGAISQYEKGTIKPSDFIIRSISEGLGFPLPFFTKKPVATSTASSVAFFRSFKTSSAKQRDAFQQRAFLISDLIIEKLKTYIQFPDVNMPNDIPIQDSYSLDDCEAIAKHLREYWGLGSGPIDSMVDVFHENGIIIANVASNNNKIDAFSLWYNGVPYTFISDNQKSSVRWRFSLAHELGHLILHSHMEEISASTLNRIEQEANWFAGAFLLPETSFFMDVSCASLEHLLYLKKKWKTSVAAMIQKCRAHDVFSPEQSTSLHRQISYRGWRKAEPLDDICSGERPYLLKQALKLVIEDGIIAPENIEMEFGLFPEELAQWCHTPMEILMPDRKKPTKNFKLHVLNSYPEGD